MKNRWAVADIHGKKVFLDMIKNFIGPEDIVYVLGDCGDRGPDGWDIIQEVYNNPQFVYLKGNHEDLFVEAMKGDTYLSFLNGGKKTYEKWKYRDGAPKGWIRKLDDLPFKIEFTNKLGNSVILTHAGFTPDPYLEPREQDYLWDRRHIYHKWPEGYDNTYIVHGHTPIPYMDDYLYPTKYEHENEIKPGVFWYAPDKNGKNHKVNIDCGACFTGCAALLNLDTWEQHIFKTEDCIYED